MKSLLCVVLNIYASYVSAQSFTGNWKGTITRDFGNDVKVDSIEINLINEGDNITGYSTLFTDGGRFIRSALKGSFQQTLNILRLHETKVIMSNVPNWQQAVFLDCYLLEYNQNQTDSLFGKTVPYHTKAGYTRSKMLLKKAVEE
jgi:hypothetical protein